MLEQIEDTIHQVTVESDSANQELKNLDDWNDNDLDQVNIQRNRFSEITQQLSKLNESTMLAFNNNQESAYGLLPAMRALYDACIRNIDSLNKSKIGKGLSSTIDNFQEEVDQLQENIEDFILIHDTLAHDDEWQTLLSQL